MKKKTILDFRRMAAEGEKIVYLTGYDYLTAKYEERAGIDMILVGDSLGNVILGYDSTYPVTMEDMLIHCKAVRRGAPNTFIVGDMPFMSYQVSDEEAVRNAGLMCKEARMDCVKLEGITDSCISRVKAINDAGMLVMGHIGLTPQSASSFGGFKMQGGTPEGAAKLVADAKALEAAGVFSIVLECVPSGVAKAVTEAVGVPILGIGAGPYVDCQVLLTHDLLDMYGDFTPRFVKQFAHIRRAMVEGLNAFHEEALSGQFPTPDYSFNRVVEGYEV